MSQEPFEGLPSELKATAQNTDPWWFDGTVRAIETLAASGRTFTTMDVATMVGPPEKPNQWGPPFTWARRRGLIVAVDATGSQRPSRHGSLVRVWVGTKEAVDAA